MKSEIPKVWQEAGLETVGPVELDRLFTADTWRVPNSVELKGEALLWDVTKNQTIKVHPGRSMLDDFIRLHNAQPDQILKYAMRWGVLGICKHGLPASHSYPSFVPEPLALQALDSICQPICSKKEPDRKSVV